MILKPKNWDSFQHYKERSPPWIKLHRTLLDDYVFFCLPVASRALAPCIWLLCSEQKDGHIDADPKMLAFRFRQTELEIIEALKPLIDNGFLLVVDGSVQDASNVLAACKQSAMPETETETEERTHLSDKSDEIARSKPKPRLLKKEPVNFSAFWLAYPRKDAKAKAIPAFVKARVDDETLARIITDLSNRRSEWTDKQFIPLPASYLNARRWEDEGTSVAKPVSIFALAR